MKYRILSLTGGGFRGYFTARVLAQLEKISNQPIGKHCDLIAGTSIGGILSLGLAAGLSAEDLAKNFCTYRNKIFDKTLGNAIKSWVECRYGNVGLQQAIIGILGDDVCNGPLKDLDRPVMLTAVCLDDAQTKLISSLDTDFNNWTVMDAALATSAAPTYFPAHEVEGKRYLDGGLSCNVPDLAALSFLMKRQSCQLGAIQILSVGTGYTPPDKANFKELDGDAGKVRWGLNIVDVFTHAQRNLIAEQREIIVPVNLHARIDSALSEHLELDDVSDNAVKVLDKAAAKAMNEHGITPMLTSFFAANRSTVL